jgi:bis(5'-nucleosidyl)-tetraphosphatase
MTPSQPQRAPAASPRVPEPTNVKKQVVAGFIIYRRTQDGIKFLLLYRRGNYWNVPKGHFNTGENSMQVALRETEEETGLKKSELRIVPNFKTHERFSFQRGSERIYDTVILYLAETHQPNVRISPREHSGYAWFLYQDAMKLLGKKYTGTKRVLKEAYDFIRPPSSRSHPVFTKASAGKSHPIKVPIAKPPSDAARQQRRG